MNSDTKRDLLQILLIVMCWILPIIAVGLPSFKGGLILQVIIGIIGLLISICYLLKHTIFKKNAKILIVYEGIVIAVGLIALA